MKSSRIEKNASWIIACKIVQAMLSIVVTMLSTVFRAVGIWFDKFRCTNMDYGNIFMLFFIAKQYL